MAHPTVDAYHFGVGGAGNIGAISTAATSNRASTHARSADRYPPEAQFRRFSTGVGGRGNIIMTGRSHNDTDGHDDAARLLQNAYNRKIALTPRSYHTGVGGYANVHPSAAKARKSGDETQRSSLSARHLSSAESSSRTSLADSMKEVLMGRRGSKAS